MLTEVYQLPSPTDMDLKRYVDSYWKVYSGQPIYFQIANFIMSFIEESEVLVETLPGHRKLAEIFGVSINTVLNALRVLQDRGEIIIQSKKRPEVVYQQHNIVSWGEYANASQFNAGKVGFAKFVAKDKAMNLSTGLESSYCLKEAFNQVLSDIRIPADLTCNFLGRWELKKEISLLLEQYHINVKSSEIMITMGVNYGLSILFLTLLGSKTNLLLPQYSSMSINHIAGMTGTTRIRLPMDNEGIETRWLEKILKASHDCILCVPTDLNIPTGVSTSDKRKIEIMDLCVKYRVPLIEHLHMPLAFYDDSFVTFKSLDKSNLVVQVSQMGPVGIATPWLGWIVADKNLLNKLLDMRLNLDGYDSYLNQFATLEILRKGIYQNYINRMRKSNTKRIPEIKNLLNKYLSDYTSWSDQNLDFSLWLDFSRKVDTFELYKMSKKITFYPGKFYDQHDHQHIFINPMSKDIETFEFGLNELKKIIEKEAVSKMNSKGESLCIR